MPLRLPHVLLAAVLLAAGPASAADPSGVWLSESGETRVRIAPCGAALCGTVLSTRGGGRDEQNPDPALRSRPLAGTRIIDGLRPSGREGEWTGTLYNHLEGRTYAGKLRMQDEASLLLSGCVLGGLVCRGQTWTRVR